MEDTEVFGAMSSKIGRAYAFSCRWYWHILYQAKLWVSEKRRKDVCNVWQAQHGVITQPME